MLDITNRLHSLRKAIATATVIIPTPEAMQALQKGEVPKGNVFEMARAAGLLAIKKTGDAIPGCHPTPVEYSAISYDVQPMQIEIKVEVHAVYKTGVEVEAMHGASIAALTFYDMLKSIDPAVSIGGIQLQREWGGKGDYTDFPVAQLRCAVVVCSDGAAEGIKPDFAGQAVVQKLESMGVNVSVYRIIPDEFLIIQQEAKSLSEEGINMLIFAGGTGLYRRDVTPEAIAPLLDINIPGIMEAARSYGQQRTPFAMLSRGVAGFIKNTLVLTLPGSTRGAEETVDALFPYLFHIFHVAETLRQAED